MGGGNPLDIELTDAMAAPYLSVLEAMLREMERIRKELERLNLNLQIFSRK